MLTVLTANSQAGGFTIANSLRFRASASAYLNRTPASASNTTTWTWSAWLKKGAITVAENVFVAGASSSNRFHFGYDGSVATGSAGDYLCAFSVIGGTITNLFQTNALFRDPSSWYHIVLVADTTQSTAANRLKLYVNGILQTFSTYNAPTQNSSLIVNGAVPHAIGSYSVTPTSTFDGYLTEINFIDGQALTPSSFGEIDSTTGVWKAKRYTGTYGTNGFRLNFSNGTSTTTLGYDSSGNGNNWTTNNISLTAGSTYDWMIDSPTPYQGSSYGVGNYCTLNPLWNTSTATHVISDGNLKITQSGAGAITLYSTLGVTSGSYYFETNATTVAGDCFIGIVQSTGSYGSNASLGNGVYRSDGTIFNGSAWVAYGATYTSGDVIGVAFNISSSTINFYKNNVAQGQKSVTYTNTIVAAIYSATSGNVLNVNFGQRPFAYTPPSGYKSLCTQNLPGVTIQNGAGYMAATLYTGNGATQSISNAVNGVSFQPDFVWTKTRSTVQNHAVYDVVRGTQQRLLPNLTNAEDTVPGVTSFNSSGFSVGANIASNESGSSFVAWQWKAGGTAVTNTAGSITSSVSANTTSGFSVVTFTTNVGGSGTFGHGLGVAPSMVIIKSRTSSIQNWVVGHTSIAWTNYLLLNATVASSANSTVWNNTAPSSTVVTLGSGFTNASYGDCVAYCFAAISGYSAFGSYTGNGSADGPFVYCGFRPRYVLIKRTNDVSNWTLRDTSRDPYNVTTLDLYPNLSNAQTSGPNIDILSNGFKCRDAGGQATNASGSTYIYAAFAENPFKYSLAR